MRDASDPSLPRSPYFPALSGVPGAWFALMLPGDMNCYDLSHRGDNKMNSMRFELELYSTKTVGTHSRWYSGRNKKYEDVDEADRNEQGRLLYRQSKQIHKSQWDCVKNSSVNKHAGPVREIACRPLEKEQVDELKSEGHHFHYESDHARTYQLATACGDGQIRFRYFEVPIGDGGMSNESVEDAAAAAAAADGPAAGAEGIPEPAKTMTNAIAYPRLESYMTKEGLTLPPFRDHKTTIHSICISHDGRYMVSSGDDVFVAKYDTVLGKSIGVFNYAVVPESSKSNRVRRRIVIVGTPRRGDGETGRRAHRCRFLTSPALDHTLSCACSRVSAHNSTSPCSLCPGC